MSRSLLLVGGAIVAVVLGLVGVIEFNKARTRNVATARAWHVEGPPCPVTTLAALKAQHQNPHRMDQYEGVVFARKTGHMECKEVASKGGLGFGRVLTCQFTSPAALLVKTGDMEAAWFPGPGQPATITVEKGQPRCVMGGDRTMSLK